MLFAVSADNNSPATIEVEGEDAIPSWVNLPRAQQMLPAGFVLKQACVADLLQILPANTGMLIEPGAGNALYLPSGERPALLARAVPFPQGASLSWGKIPTQAQELARSVSRSAGTVEQLAALWIVRYKIEDASDRVALIYQPTNAGDDDRTQIMEWLRRQVAESAPAFKVQIVALGDIPLDVRGWLDLNPDYRTYQRPVT